MHVPKAVLWLQATINVSPFFLASATFSEPVTLQKSKGLATAGLRFRRKGVIVPNSNANEQQEKLANPERQHPVRQSQVEGQHCGEDDHRADESHEDERDTKRRPKEHLEGREEAASIGVDVRGPKERL